MLEVLLVSSSVREVDTTFTSGTRERERERERKREREKEKERERRQRKGRLLSSSQTQTCEYIRQLLMILTAVLKYIYM